MIIVSQASWSSGQRMLVNSRKQSWYPGEVRPPKKGSQRFKSAWEEYWSMLPPLIDFVLQAISWAGEGSYGLLRCSMVSALRST